LTPLKDLGRVMRTVTKHSPAKLSVLGEVEGVLIRNEAMVPRGSARFVATGGRLFGSYNRAKGRALT
jgi:hypothetical protein